LILNIIATGKWEKFAWQLHGFCH